MEPSPVRARFFLCSSLRSGELGLTLGVIGQALTTSAYTSKLCEHGENNVAFKRLVSVILVFLPGISGVRRHFMYKSNKDNTTL